MRTDRILELAGHIDGLHHSYATTGPAPSRWVKPTLFSMDRYCGTIACIAGHAVALFGTRGDKRAFYKGVTSSDGDPVLVPMKLLGIKDHMDAEDLFLPPTNFMSDITETQAATALRLVAEGCSPVDAWEEAGVAMAI